MAAGQGSRLRPLTEGIPKCLLGVGNKTILDTLIPHALIEPQREIVVVGGYCADILERHLNDRYPAHRIQFVRNHNFANDVNILSMDIGVDALKTQERGYTIIETDLLLAPKCWDVIHSAETSDNSFWVTSGRYNSKLTGGIVHVPLPDGKIKDIAYVPTFDPAYQNWHKMVGILSVATSQVAHDRQHRKSALREGSLQYYMAPWIKHAQDLPCMSVDLGSMYARSFNTIGEYKIACHEFSTLFPEETT